MLFENCNSNYQARIDGVNIEKGYVNVFVQV